MLSGHVTEGYEGAPHGLIHCDAVGCVLTADPDVCQHAVRAELNALLRAGRRGESTVGSTLWCTVPVHQSVVGALINAGVRKVVCPALTGPVEQALRLANVAWEFYDDATTK